jgi:hypothetical protein
VEQDTLLKTADYVGQYYTCVNVWDVFGFILLLAHNGKNTILFVLFWKSGSRGLKEMLYLF